MFSKTKVLMWTYTIAHILSDKQFKRRFGVERQTFITMVEHLQPSWRPTPKRGVKPIHERLSA